VERIDICGYLKNRKRGMFCKLRNFANSHRSGDLVNDASGLSAHPVGAKDLTFQPFVGNMGAARSS
jgi:hypothetical protein